MMFVFVRRLLQSGLALLMLSAPLLSACDPGTLRLLSSPDVNLTSSNYAAADMLVQQSQAHLSQNTILALGALSDLKDPESRAPFGKMVAGQVGARLVQLGYNVNIPDDIGTVSAGDMPASPAQPVIKAPLEGTAVSVGNVQAMVTGHYVRSGSDVLINLRLVDMGTGRIWGAYDYNLPITNQINDMLSAPRLAKDSAEKAGLFDF
ncbi:MAG: FlgO family outer membrane protein [Alphaproteobacteria bacterium]|nr:FlgO family outer membrane protein [Alphaproteobacteria bacterium]